MSNKKLPFGDMSEPLVVTGEIIEPFDGDTGTFALKWTWSRFKTSVLHAGKSNFRILDRFSSDDDIVQVFAVFKL